MIGDDYMKKSKYVLILLLAITIFPVLVNALDGQITVSCNDTVIRPGGILTCSISGSGFSAPISSFHGEIALGEGLTLESATNDSSWMGDASGGIIDLYTATNKTGDINFVSFVIKAADNVSGTLVVNVGNIIISDDDFKEYNFDVVTKEIKLSSTNNNVNDVIIDGNNDSSNNNGAELDNETVNNVDVNNEIINENNDNTDVLEQDNNTVKDSKTNNIWLAIVLLMVSIIFICVIIYLRKRGSNV